MVKCSSQVYEGLKPIALYIMIMIVIVVIKHKGCKINVRRSDMAVDGKHRHTFRLDRFFVVYVQADTMGNEERAIYKTVSGSRASLYYY